MLEIANLSIVLEEQLSIDEPAMRRVKGSHTTRKSTE